MTLGMRFAIGVALTAACAAPARAQSPLSLTVDEAIQRAVAQAPRIAEARSRESAARSTVTARAAAGSRGGPMTPGPASCIAPKPMRPIGLLPRKEVLFTGHILLLTSGQELWQVRH